MTDWFMVAGIVILLFLAVAIVVYSGRHLIIPVAVIPANMTVTLP